MIQNQRSSEQFLIEQELYDKKQINRELTIQCELLKKHMDKQRKEA